MSSSFIVLPGDQIEASKLPISSKSEAVLKLGPHLRHVAPSAIMATAAGQLCMDTKKHAVWIEMSNSRYIPSPGDLVIAQVHHSSGDNYMCSLSSHTAFAILPHLSFPMATRKSRPQLTAGALVYARVASADKYLDPELECVHPATNKAEGLGELKGGMIFAVSNEFARRLMMNGSKGGIVLMDEFAKKVPFEVAIGRNGKIWIQSKTAKSTLVIGKALEKVDIEDLSVDDQQALVRKLLRSG